MRFTAVACPARTSSIPLRPPPSQLHTNLGTLVWARRKRRTDMMNIIRQCSIFRVAEITSLCVDAARSLIEVPVRNASAVRTSAIAVALDAHAQARVLLLVGLLLSSLVLISTGAEWPRVP